MHISQFSLVAILVQTSGVIAAPVAAPKCNAVDVVYGILKGPLQAKASSICLSFLGGDKSATQTSTQTVTGSAVTTTLTPAVQVVTTTASTVNVNTVTVTSDEQAPNPTTTTTVTITAATRTIYQKREATPMVVARDVPWQLAPFASSRISSACACIVTPTTRTTTITTTQSVAGSTSTQTLATPLTTTTTTNVIQTTTTSVVTRTLGPVGTITVTIQATVTPILVKPKICNARGLPGANAFNYDANFNTNQAACIASCKTDDRCLATGFYIVTDPSTGSQTGTCRKYDKSVTDSADLGPGYYNFNDKAC